MKTVFQTDSNGWYVGVTSAFESPLEPGVYLMPAGCTDVEPPTPGDGQAARLIAGTWVLQVPPPVVEPSPVDLLAAFLAANPAVASLVSVAQPT